MFCTLRRLVSFSIVTLVCCSLYASDAYLFDITDFGAVGDGKTLCTEAIQGAVDACTNTGGGKVIVPPGNYLTGPVFLKSNVHLEIMSGATLLGSENFEDYPPVEGRWEGIERKVYASLLTGHDLVNVTISGRGKLDGQGEVWWEAFKITKAMREDLGLTEREPDHPEGAPLKYPRPRMINLYRCNNVLIEGITIVDSPAWTVHTVYCHNVVVQNLTIIQDYRSPNTDGINPDSCTGVRISNCYIDVGDDCITLKSGYNADGRRVNLPCEDITITNCTMIHGHGGVVIGSEMSGDVRNVTISNCVFHRTKRGLRIKTIRGRGGVVERIRASNIVMEDIEEIALSMTMFWDIEKEASFDARPVTEETPAIRDIHFSGVTVSGVEHAGVIEGIAEMPIEDFSLTGVRVTNAKQGIKLSVVKDVYLSDVVVDTESGSALQIDHAEGVDIHRFETRQPHAETPVIALRYSKDLAIHGCRASDGTDVFLEVQGSKNQRIRMGQNRIEDAKTPVRFSGGARKSVLSVLD